MLLDGLQSISAAGGGKTAAGADHRRNEAAIEADHGQHHPGHSATEIHSEGLQRAAR